MTDHLTKMLDSMTETGIYVIAQDTHRILYFNKRVKDVAPSIETGMICHEVWEGTCKNCPLLTMGEGSSSHTINYGDPFGDMVDISADRLIWEDGVPAYVITVSQHKMSADEIRMEREVMQLARAASSVYSRILSVNLTQNSLKVLGYDAVTDRRMEDGTVFDEWLADTLESMHPEDRAEYAERFCRENLLTAFQNGEKDISMEYRKKEEDGNWHWLSSQVIPVENLYGGDCLEITMIRNIDEGKRRQEEYRSYLKEQNEGNRKLLQMALDGTSIYEFYYYPTEKRIVNSRRLSEKFGYPVDMEKVPECFGQYMAGARYAEAVSSVFYRILSGKKNGSCVFRTADERFWVRVNLSVVSCSEQGNPTYVVGLLEDITKEKEHEKKLRSLEQRNEEILFSVNSLYFAVNSINLDTETIRFIKAYNDLEKLEIADTSSYPGVLHQVSRRLYAPGDGERFEQDFSVKRLQECWNIGQERFSGEYRRMVNGRFHWISCTAYFMNNELHRKIVIMALQDIDEQHMAGEKEREEERKKERETKELLQDALNRAERASKAKSDFLSKMSHDIRTPMNAIMGMTMLAENYIDSKEKVRECLGKISISGQHMMELINEVLDMSKIESGTLDLTVGEFNLSELIQNTLTMIRPSVETKGQQLIVNAVNVRHENVMGDRLRLQQVFNNILTNACKYTPQEGTIRVSVEELTAGSGSSSCFRFTFKDTGIGIDEKFLPHLFEPFTRATDSRTSKISGTGLGMAITSNIVQMMNGDIQVESVPNEGTAFTVTVPLLLSEHEETEIKGLKGKAVLVADDEESARQQTGRIITALGMTCDMVDSGEKALRKVRRKLERGEHYFAVILDWAMPELDGVETAEALRRIPGTEKTVIILCAYDWSAVEQEALAAGVNRYLQKPLFRSALAELFRSLDRERLTGEEGREDFGRGKRILLVEDNELNMEIACEMLSIIGVQVETAENGEEAVKKFESVEEGYYDLIFMDIRMPVMDGYEATKRIRKLNRSDAAAVPIIAMTADAFSDDVRKALDAGMNEHMSKPIDLAGMTKAMKRWIR